VSANDSRLDWVLAMAPYRRDADYLEVLLTQHGVPVQRAAGVKELAVLLEQSPGTFVATHEALNAEVLETVRRFLTDQPAWSEMPLVILLDRTASQARIRSQLSAAWPRSRQIYYQRPVTALELLSGVQSSLLARLRQRDVRDHIEREIELRRELNHRVKNILASISSIFEMTRRRAVSLNDFSNDFAGRLAALANVHSAVFQANGGAVDLRHIVDLTFSPYEADSHNRLVYEGPSVLLSPEAATTLALCLHELATNALKYGALSEPEGRIRLEWSASSSDDILTLRHYPIYSARRRASSSVGRDCTAPSADRFSACR
jgi:two-component sensor histidine kinase